MTMKIIVSLTLMVSLGLGYANEESLGEDPFLLAQQKLKESHSKRRWLGKSQLEKQAWIREHLHLKLRAKKVIVDSNHPEWAWFRKSGLGLFLHWGLASVKPNNGDAWAMVWHPHRERTNKLIKPEDMFKVADTWNPSEYDAQKWMKAAANAGFGYSVLTTRHHDGYCLWPSEYGAWDTGEKMDGRDLVKDYIEACRDNGIKVGLYYSGPNWHFAYKKKNFIWPANKKFQVNYKHEKTPADSGLASLMTSNPALPGDLDQQELQQSRGQVKELVTKYGKIDMMWWDGSRIMSEEELAKFQPEIFVARGNIATPEGLHQGTSENVKMTNEAGWWWEMCIKSENKFTPNWHYGEICETNHWTTNTLLTELIRCRSLGGNLLVNIPPKGNGEMMDWYYQLCEEMAAWMKHSKEAIYDVDLKAPLPTLDKTQNYTTVKGNKWYSLPDEQGVIHIEEVRKPRIVILMHTGEELDYDYEDGELKIFLDKSKWTTLPDMVKIVFPENK